jgi:hypothetical protein
MRAIPPPPYLRRMADEDRHWAGAGDEQQAGSFTTEWSDDAVLDLAGEIARAVSPASPERVSMPQWDNELIRRRGRRRRRLRSICASTRHGVS